MRFRLNQLVCFSLVAGSLLLANEAQAAVSQSSEDQQLQQVIVQTKALEQEVSELSAEVKQLKQQKYAAQKHAVSRKKAAARKTYASAAPNGTTKPPVPAHTETQRLTQGVTVTTSPLLGIRSSFDSSDLLVNLSTMNEDLRLLQQRQQLRQELAKEGEPAVWEDRALLELSGGIEAQAFDSHPYTGPSSTDIDLTRGELDALAYISKDVLGLMSFTYDNSPLPSNIEGSGERFANSRVILRRGFITIGNLDITPIYFSIGQMYAPFGSYSSQIVTTPLPLPVGKVNQRIALLGFSKDGVYGSVYGFKGDTNVESTGIDNGGVNLGYKYSGTGPVSGVNIGAGGIVNIADALGMQATGASAQFFQGFSMNSTTEELDHRVPGLNVHGEVDISKFNFLGEYSGATKAFSADNLSMNNEGAQPRASHLEGDYNFTVFDKYPTVFTLAYDHSWDGLPLNLPKDSYMVVLNTSIWKDTIESLEYRHDTNYPSSDVSAGNGSPVPAASPGGSQNTVTAQIGAYF